MKSEKDAFEGMEDLVAALTQVGGEDLKQDLSDRSCDLTRRRAAEVISAASPSSQQAWWLSRAVALTAAAAVLVVSGLWVFVGSQDMGEIVEAPAESVEVAIQHLQHRMDHDLRELTRRYAPGRRDSDLLDRSDRLSREIAMRSMVVTHELVRAGALDNSDAF